ncbi:hypothetical protein BaRGS_00022838 [Batillaria attramentaria]|uniref:Uncharacterized protein n=1 Tax=Batillaria attramentaria TaxID=370345 RepID=A0ABD0KFZ4_9CAEN
MATAVLPLYRQWRLSGCAAKPMPSSTLASMITLADALHRTEYGIILAFIMPVTEVARSLKAPYTGQAEPWIKSDLQLYHTDYGWLCCMRNGWSAKLYS